MIKFELVPIKDKKIKSPFNNARKSNVGIDSCTTMQQSYQRKIKELDAQIEASINRLSLLEDNDDTLRSDLSDNINGQGEVSTKKDKKEMQKGIIRLGKDIDANNKEMVSEHRNLEDLREKREYLKEEMENKFGTLNGGITSQIYTDDSTDLEVSHTIEDLINDFQKGTQTFISQLKSTYGQDIVLIEALKNENKILKDENNGLKTEIESLKETNKVMVDDATEYHKTVISKINEANASIQRQNDVSKDLVKKLSERDQKIVELEKALSSKNQELLKVNQQFKEFTSAIQQANNDQFDLPQNSSQDGDGIQYTKKES